jgi:cold shock CspA family protein
MPPGRESRPDDLAREAAGTPPEPLGNQTTTIGTVKWWRQDKGYGAIATDATAPWDVWCHISAFDGPLVFTMPSGARVPVTRDALGRMYLPSGEPVVGIVEGVGIAPPEVGERVEVSYIRADQESFRYVARLVRRQGSSSGVESPAR